VSVADASAGRYDQEEARSLVGRPVLHSSVLGSGGWRVGAARGPAVRWVCPPWGTNARPAARRRWAGRPAIVTCSTAARYGWSSLATRPAWKSDLSAVLELIGL